MKLRNISPLGELSIPGLGVSVPSGAVLNVPDDIAVGLVGQGDTWVEVVPSGSQATTPPEPEPEPADVGGAASPSDTLPEA